MTERKFTDEEVIEALECCASAGCDICTWEPSGGCYRGPLECCDDLIRQALDLINRQRAEIERLTIEYAGFRGAANSLKMHYNNARSEAIKEFAERLKEKHRRITDYDEAGFGCQIFIVEEDYIDHLIKEMTEGKPYAEGADCSTEEGKG